MIGVAFGHSVEQSVGRAADGATPFICVRVMGRRVAAQVRPTVLAVSHPSYSRRFVPPMRRTPADLFAVVDREACQPGRVVHFPLKLCLTVVA